MFWKKQCKTYEKLIECFISTCDGYAQMVDKLRGEIKLRDEVIDHQNELLELYQKIAGANTGPCYFFTTFIVRNYLKRR